MQLADFKKIHGIQVIDFKDTNDGNRFIAKHFSDKLGTEITILTKPKAEFDKSKPVYMYESLDATTGEVLPDVFVASNKAGFVAKPTAFSL